MLSNYHGAVVLLDEKVRCCLSLSTTQPPYRTEISRIVRQFQSQIQSAAINPDCFLMPANVGGSHWILFAIFIKATRIERYDSMGGHGGFRPATRWVTILSNLRNVQHSFRGDGWTCTHPTCGNRPTPLIAVFLLSNACAI